jgi:hypothetical protein
MKRERWEDCRKAVASSEETAREYLAYLLRHAANFHKPSGYVVRPYPYGNGLHVGRDHRRLIIDFRIGKSSHRRATFVAFSRGVWTIFPFAFFRVLAPRLI